MLKTCTETTSTVSTSTGNTSTGTTRAETTHAELVRHALHGPTMGTRWSALFFAEAWYVSAPLHAALQAVVDKVDRQMSTWNPDSDLMRLNAAPVGTWVAVPKWLLEVLRLGLEIGRASDGAFDIGMGDAVAAWGFGPEAATLGRIRSASSVPRRPAHEILVIEDGWVCKSVPMVLDLNGIAKGYGVDRLVGTLCGESGRWGGRHNVDQRGGGQRADCSGDQNGNFRVRACLVGIDGEMRGVGCRPDGEPWTIAVEAPDPERRSSHSVVALRDAAIATSGDYRHWVNVRGRRLSHTMDPGRGAPLLNSPASVSIVASCCAEADAWATALMVLGPDKGATTARQRGLDALFLLRDDDKGTREVAVGRLFSYESAAIVVTEGA